MQLVFAVYKAAFSSRCTLHFANVACCLEWQAAEKKYCSSLNICDKKFNLYYFWKRTELEPVFCILPSHS